MAAPLIVGLLCGLLWEVPANTEGVVFDSLCGIGVPDDVDIDVDINAAINSDKLSDTIDYSLVIEIVRREMKVRSKLVEHVAGRIAKAILKESPRIEEVKVKVSKMNPPVSGEVARFSVEVKEKRK